MDIELTEYLGKLSKITFTKEELEEMTKDMTDIVNLMDTVKEAPVKYDALADNKNIYLDDLRKDEPWPSMDRDKILQNAKRAKDSFVVPKVVE